MHSKAVQLHTHMCIHTCVHSPFQSLPRIGYYRLLDRVPCAVQGRGGELLLKARLGIVPNKTWGFNDHSLQHCTINFKIAETEVLIVHSTKKEMIACDRMEVLANPEGDSRCNKYTYETKKSIPLKLTRVLCRVYLN